MLCPIFVDSLHKFFSCSSLVKSQIMYGLELPDSWIIIFSNKLENLMCPSSSFNTIKPIFWFSFATHEIHTYKWNETTKSSSQEKQW